MNGATEPMVPNWIFDLSVLVAIVVIPLALWIWSLIERAWQIRQQRLRALDDQEARAIEEDALDLRMAIGLTLASRDGLLEQRLRPPEDIQ